jgi:hypothetical protein
MTAGDIVERNAGSGAHSAQDPFLASHRANAVCRRELDRMHAELTRQLTELAPASISEPVEVRASPDRWIVQLGPVALTIAWLLGARDTIADGELLAIVWQGIPGRRRSQHPERLGVAHPPSASGLWEQVLTPVAANETTWGWVARGTDAAILSSAEVAARCVARLHAAYARVVTES